MNNNFISRGAPAKYAHYGNIKKSYNSSRISCSSCEFYNKYDRSCNKKPIYVPEVGWNYWKYCKKFELTEEYKTPRNIAYVRKVHTSFKVPKSKVNEVAHNIKNKTINSNTSSSVSLKKKVNSKILNIITILDFEMKETETYKIIDSPKSNLEKMK